MIRIVLLEAKNLNILESAIGIAKYRYISETKVQGFAVHGIFRKTYYAVVTGIHGDLKRMVAFVDKHPKRIKAYYSDFIEGQHFNEDKGEWEKGDDALP